MKTNEQYSTNETVPAKTSCDVLNNGPGALVAKFGRTSVSMVSAANTANAALAP